MRWHQLFADLSAQFEEADAAAERAESASRARAEVGAIRLMARLGGAVGSPLTAHCRAAVTVSGVLTEVGSDWLLLVDAGNRENLVAGAAVRSVTGLGRATAAGRPGVVQRRWDLRLTLRALARDRSAMHVTLDDGRQITGTLDRVGADFFELAEHPADEPRRADAVRGVQAVDMGALVVARRVAPALG